VLVAPGAPLSCVISPLKVKEALVCATTVSATVAVCDKLPEVAVSVIVAIPAAAEGEAESVSCEELPADICIGFGEAVTPAESPLTAIVTVPVKGLLGVEDVTEIMTGALEAPAVTDVVVGETEKEKSEVGVAGVVG
jgi:hypothetical protein